LYGVSRKAWSGAGVLDTRCSVSNKYLKKLKEVIKKIW
jgi:hypothetical protein